MATTKLLPTCLLLLIFFPASASSQVCQKSCGKQDIKYPFGTASGCGDPRFQSHVSCNDGQVLTFRTHTGSYPVTSIDYVRQLIYVTDPSMSTCACRQPSRGFGLDWDAPFAFSDDTVFALLDCSPDSSPIFKSYGTAGNSSSPQLCDSHGAAVCNLLSSCQAISRVDITSSSSCCVYVPVNLGPSFEMDLRKLQCASYSGFYGFNDMQSDPQSWIYGVALNYKFNFNNEYPAMCAGCEKSNGVCGYNIPSNLFSCICPGGYNTTTDCFYGASWGNAPVLLPFSTGMWLAILYLVVSQAGFFVNLLSC